MLEFVLWPQAKRSFSTASNSDATLSPKIAQRASTTCRVATTRKPASGGYIKRSGRPQMVLSRPGYHVHHADHDPLNNDLSNLVLLDADEHLKHHGSHPKHAEHLRRVQPLGQEAAKEWHASPEGLAWHSENGKRSWEGREPRTYTCEHCGKSYESLKPSNNRFCSNACKHYARLASGVDDVEKTCEFCGVTFTANKYIRKVTCSKSCGVKLGKRRRSERLAAEATLPLAA